MMMYLISSSLEMQILFRRVTREVLKKFKRSIVAYYKDGVHDPFDPYHLWQTFIIYFNFLKQTADPRLTTVNKHQWADYELAVKNHLVFIWRTRRGGKTIFMSVLEVFWSLIDFGEVYPGVVVHRCPSGDQLRMLFYWFRLNPFVTKIDRKDFLVHVINSNPIWAAMTTEHNADGFGCSVLYEDEWGTEDFDGLKATYLESTRNFIIEGSFNGKRRLKASTVHYGSVGHEDIKLIEAEELRTNKKLISKMTWHECIKKDGTSWIPDEEKEKLIREHLFNPSFIKEMFECELVPKGGLFFNPKQWFVAGECKEYPLSFLDKFRTDSAGWDFNGDDAGHIEERGYWDRANNMIIIKEEKKWDRTDSIAAHIKRDDGVSHEIPGIPKTGAYDAGFSEHLKELETPCIYQNWDYTKKNQRLAILQNSILVIHPDCKWLIKNLRECIYDKKSVIPIMLKTTTQHGIDACSHLVHDAHDSIDFANEYSQEQFEVVSQYLQYRR
jgi:hypothetical protein